MNINELNTTLTSFMKSYIKERGYVNSGKLMNSIRFNSTDSNNQLRIKFDAEDYINYLDNETFIDDFFSQDKVLNLIADYQAELFDKQIQEALNKL